MRISVEGRVVRIEPEETGVLRLLARLLILGLIGLALHLSATSWAQQILKDLLGLSGSAGWDKGILIVQGLASFAWIMAAHALWLGLGILVPPVFRRQIGPGWMHRFQIDDGGISSNGLFGRRDFAWQELTPFRLHDEMLRDGTVQFWLMSHDAKSAVPDSHVESWEKAKLRLVIGQSSDGLYQAQFCDWLNAWREAAIRGEKGPLPQVVGKGRLSMMVGFA